MFLFEIVRDEGTHIVLPRKHSDGRMHLLFACCLPLLAFGVERVTGGDSRSVAAVILLTMLGLLYLGRSDLGRLAAPRTRRRWLHKGIVATDDPGGGPSYRERDVATFVSMGST